MVEDRVLVAAHPAPTLLLDVTDDRIVDVNDAAAGLLGYTVETLRSTRFTALHPGQRGALVVFSQAVMVKGRYRTRTLSPQTKSGARPDVEYFGGLVADPSGRLLIALSIEDLAERRRRDLHDEAERHMRDGLDSWQHSDRVFRNIERENQLILRAAGEGIYGVNAQGETTFVNPAAARMLGWSADELVGRDMHTTVHHTHGDGSPYPHTDCPIYGAFRDGLVHRISDEVFWRRDGSCFHVEYTSTPIRDRGHVVGAVIVFRDVSSRREADEHLRKALAEVDALRRRLELENAYLLEEIRREDNARGILGQSPAIARLLSQIELVAPTEATVLINGESGTGKELIARAIHDAGARRNRPLIRVNCAAIPRELFESEFFGHVRGAFTGAIRDRVGRFELADGGTLLLDEVGEIPTELQSKLLRVLQEGQFERVGEERTRTVNVRVIAATNRDLRQGIAAKTFREDLYYRLNVFPIESSPLRERREDIPLLAAHFLEEAARKLGCGALRLTEGDARRLTAYEWPGNVRELQNVVERAAILSRAGRPLFELPDGHAMSRPAATSAPSHVHTAVESERERRDRERQNITRALVACNGRVAGPGGAAEMLGLKPTTLASRIKALGIERRIEVTTAGEGR